jgi:hypothetical protein
VILRLSIVLLAGAALLLPIPTSIIERYYSSGVFPPLQRVITSLSNRVGFALFDVFVACAVVALLVLIGRGLAARASWPRRLFRVATHLVVAGAVAYLAFLLAWGLNYRREPLRGKLPYAAERVSSQNAALLAREAVAALNARHASAHAAGWADAGEVDARLVAAFHDAAGTVGGSRQTIPGRPKRTLLDLYFRRAGVAGMTDPYFLETLVTSTLLPFERPSVVAHEWAHLAGFSDEGEANFIGWLACLRGDAPHQYSGWLFLYTEVVTALPRDLGREIGGTLDAGPRADLQAIRTRLLGDISPRVSAAGWQVYDQYLKANNVGAGTASYAEVVQLVLGTGIR